MARACMTCPCPRGGYGSYFCRRCITGFMAWSRANPLGSLHQYAELNAPNHHETQTATVPTLTAWDLGQMSEVFINPDQLQAMTARINDFFRRHDAQSAAATTPVGPQASVVSEAEGEGSIP